MIKKSKGDPQGSKESSFHPREEQNRTIEKERSNEDKEKPSFGGFVIVDRVNEPLKATLDAYNSQTIALIEIPKKLKRLSKS